jgi:hypothetical protein
VDRTVSAGGIAMKKCPFCAENIQNDAVVCRYCQRDLAPNEPSGGTAILGRLGQQLLFWSVLLVVGVVIWLLTTGTMR